MSLISSIIFLTILAGDVLYATTELFIHESEVYVLFSFTLLTLQIMVPCIYSCSIRREGEKERTKYGGKEKKRERKRKRKTEGRNQAGIVEELVA